MTPHDKKRLPFESEVYTTSTDSRTDRGLDEPFYPILRVDELPSVEDQRSNLPLEVSKYLRPEEKVINIRIPEVVWPARSFSALEICMKAARAKKPDEIGYNGPTVASINIFDKIAEKSRYERQHGRDDIQVAMDLFPLYPKLADTTAVSLAESQGVENEPYSQGAPFGQEKVGSIILVDYDPSDPSGKKFTRLSGWRARNYFSVDAPLSYINLLAKLQSSDPSYLLARTYKPLDGAGEEFTLNLAFDRSVQWLMENSGEHEGLVAYKNPIKGGGMRNQGWRDSASAMVHKNGDWASDEHGIAPIEVQGLAFDAYRNAEKVYRELYKDKKMADLLADRALALQKQVLDYGFSDRGFFVSGFDWDHRRGLRQLDTATSAAGRLLGTGLVRLSTPETQEKVRQTISTLLSPDMLTRWGIRTLSAAETAHVPFLYHVGPVWPHDTNEIARSFSNLGYYGLDRIVGATTTNLHDATGVYFEHVSGYNSEEPITSKRDTYVYNRRYDETYLFEQVPPPGQTWAASTEVAKHQRHLHIPLHADDPARFKFEKKQWHQLPNDVKAVVSYYEPKLALALQG